TRFRSFRRRKSVEDRVAVLAGQKRERRPRPRLGGESCGEIVRYLDRRRTGIGGSPASVRTRLLDPGLPRWLHSPPRDEPRGTVNVPLRPGARRPPGREALPVAPRFAATQLTVDPAVAERLLQGLLVRQSSQRTSASLRQHQPHPCRRRMVTSEPGRPRRSIPHDQLGQIATHSATQTKPALDGLRVKADATETTLSWASVQECPLRPGLRLVVIGIEDVEVRT